MPMYITVTMLMKSISINMSININTRTTTYRHRRPMRRLAFWFAAPEEFVREIATIVTF